MRITKKKLAAVAVGTAVAVTGATVAFAYFTASGSGSGTATTSNGVTNIDVKGDGSATIADFLAPNFTAPDITFTVSNVATQSAYVTSVSAYLEITNEKTGTLDTDGCKASDYTIDNSTASDVATGAVDLANWDEQELGAVGTATASDTATFSLQFKNDPVKNQDACKGAKVNIKYIAA